LSFNSERDDYNEDFEEENGLEIDVLDGAAAVMVAESTQTGNEEPLSEHVAIVRFRSEELSPKKGGYTSSAGGKKLSATGRLSSVKRDSNVKKGGQLTVKEDRVEGQVTWATYAQYAEDGGGYAFWLH
jgi:hypothetical protein